MGCPAGGVVWYLPDCDIGELAEGTITIFILHKRIPSVRFLDNKNETNATLQSSTVAKRIGAAVGKRLEKRYSVKRCDCCLRAGNTERSLSHETQNEKGFIATLHFPRMEIRETDECNVAISYETKQIRQRREAKLHPATEKNSKKQVERSTSEKLSVPPKRGLRKVIK